MPPKRQAPTRRVPAGDAPVKQETAPSAQATAGASQPVPDDAPAPSPSGGRTSATPGRLDSIVRPTSASGRGGKPLVTPRPKFAGRRSQAAREEAQQVEARKKAAEAEAAAAEARQSARDARRFGYGSRGDRGARGARGRGRGGHMGDSQRQREGPIASGPFSAGQVSSDGSARRSGGGGGGGAGSGFGPGGSRYVSGGGDGSYKASGGSMVKSESGITDYHISGGTGGKIEDGGYVSSDEEEEQQKGPKQNIDRMQVIDLTVEEERAFAPVRLTRVPHKDRTVGLNAEDVIDSSDAAETVLSEKKKGKQKAKDLEVTGATERPRRPTAYSSSDTETEPRIKKEPTDNDQVMISTPPEHTGEPVDLAITGVPQDMPSSPESRRNAKAKIKAMAEAITEGENVFPIPAAPKFQTQAEKDEWDRKYLDLNNLRDELGLLVPGTAEQLPDAEGDPAMSEPTQATERAKRQQQEREQHLYLFQFPPVLPSLEPVQVKPDSESAGDPPASSEAMDVDQEGGPVAATAEADTKKEVTAVHSQPKLPSGSVGKLRIHRSGKATLDWGGTSLSLGMGIDSHFLQSIMIAKVPERKPEDDDTVTAADQEHAVGMGMGTIRGKFVATPNWEEILR